MIYLHSALSSVKTAEFVLLNSSGQIYLIALEVSVSFLLNMLKNQRLKATNL